LFIFNYIFINPRIDADRPIKSIKQIHKEKTTINQLQIPSDQGLRP